MESSTELPAMLSGELVFSDIIDNICQLLTIKELYSVSKVCKTWKKAATHEMRKRGRSQISIFPCLLRQDLENKILKFNALDELYTKPEIALLFFSRNHAFRPGDLEDVMKFYGKQLECKILAIKNEESWFNLEQKIILNDLGLRIPFGVPSFLLPILKQSNILTSWCTTSERTNLSETIKKMTEELCIPSDQDPSLNIIILAANEGGCDVGRSFVETIHDLYSQKPCSLWGLEHRRLQFLDCNNQEYGKISDIQDLILIGIRILGPGTSCWSCMIDNYIQSWEFDDQLIKFKERIQLKRYSLGFVCGPALVPYDEDLVFDNQGHLDQKYHDSLQFMRAIKSTFPDVQFIGAFNYDFLNVYGCNSSNDGNKVIIEPLIVSLMIISYD